jgi:hypothetical protein
VSDARPSRVPSAPPPLWAELVGWYGTFAIIGAYGANSFGWLSNADSLYRWLNLTGAAGVGIVCFYRRTWQAFALEAVWFLIALAALVGVPAR